MRQVVAPLEREGVDLVKFAPRNQPETVVEKDDLDAYEPPALDDTLSDQEHEMVVELAAARSSRATSGA